MPFDPVAPKTPTHISRLTLHLATLKADDGITVSYNSRYSLDIVDASGAIMSSRDAELGPHLLETEKVQLKTIIDRLRATAETEIIGP